MTVFDDLFAVQEHDTRADQVRHRLAHLPERAARVAHLDAAATFERETDELRSQRDAIARDQRRLEDEVASVEAKAAEVDKTLYSGTITAPKELQAFQDDIASLKRRQGQLEDEIIELMEQIEPLDEQLASRAEERARSVTEGARLEAALVEVEAELVVEQRQLDAERAALVSAIPADLLAEYDTLRSQLGGVAIARLVGSNCGGCHLTLSAVALDTIGHQSSDVRAYCEECGRLLVH